MIVAEVWVMLLAMRPVGVEKIVFIFKGDDGEESPPAFVATTVIEYIVFAVSPVRLQIGVVKVSGNATPFL